MTVHESFAIRAVDSGDIVDIGDTGALGVAGIIHRPHNGERPTRARCEPFSFCTIGALGAPNTSRSGSPSIWHSPSAEARGSVPVVEYTIANLPTLYRGRMYRSRLEARWAAFFDRLGWTYEYEPFDLGAWSPDFAITEPFDALIEVKPLTEPDHDLFERIHSAGGKGAKFVTRVAPEVRHSTVRIGWWVTSYCPALIAWAEDPDEPKFYADIFSLTNPPDFWVTATRCGGRFDEQNPDDILRWYPEHTMGLWADACNAVQWEPKQ